MKYILNILIALDQVGTTLVGGWPDETLSAYAYRMKLQGKPAGCLSGWIDALFFWQPNHTKVAYENERARVNSPPEVR